MTLKTLQELDREYMAERTTILQGSETENTRRKARCGDSKCKPAKSLISRQELIEPLTPGWEHKEPLASRLEPIEPLEPLELLGIRETNSQAEKPGKKQRGKFAVIADVIFYLAIALILFAAASSGANGGAPKTIMGYSYFTVLTPSMQKELPKGSLILVRHTQAQELRVGDNITFMVDAGKSITHKIMGIYENYQGSGGRGFQTQGVNNASPDREIVYEKNVVGKVIFSVPAAGAVISGLAANIHIVFIIFGLCVILSFSLRGLLAKPENPGRKKQTVKTAAG